MNDAPTSEAPSAAKPLTPTALTSYEAGIALIDGILSSGDMNAKDDVLKQIKTFFEKRVAKKASGDQKDGFGYVKKTLESQRSFKKYERPSVGATGDKPGGTLFG